MRQISRGALTVDVVSAAVFAAVGAPFLVTQGPQYVVSLLGFAASLAVRRLAPGWALGLAWAAALLQMLTLSELHWGDLAVLGVLYSTAAHGGRTVRWLGLASACGGAIIGAGYLVFVKPWFAPNADQDGVLVGTAGVVVSVVLLVALLAILVLSWVTGLLVRTVRQHREARRREELALRERELVEYRYAVEQERNRIARDMHDVVAHSLAVVIAQSDGARFASATRPETAVAALGTIAEVARGALGDVRMLLAELRHNGGDAPQPELDDLAVLVGRVRSAGLDVRFTETGERLPLGTGHRIALYRIAQESLTNALRHGAPGGPVELVLAWDAEGADLETVNRMPDGPAPEPAPFRHGLPGMRERAHLAGGTLHAEPDGAGRFVVRARIPAQPGARA